MIENKEFLKQLELLRLKSNRFLQGKLGGTLKTNKFGKSFDFIDYRSYSPGDDFKNIDWNIYSRLGEIVVRLFHAYEDFTVHFILDTSKSMDFQNTKKKELAIKLLLGLSYVGLSNKEKIKVYTTNDKHLITENKIYTKKKSILEIEKFIYSNKFNYNTDWSSLFEELNKNINKKGMIFILSDFMNQCDWKTEFKKVFFKGHDVAVIQILSEFEMNPDINGDYLFIDSETNQSIDLTIDNFYLKEYKKKIKAYIDYLKSSLYKNKFGYALCSDKENFIDVIINLLRNKISGI